jgi:metal-responsive CopG/Arc/MetJ family transcriptional regulator
MCMRLHINLDDEMAREIDELVGPRGRSKYIREAIAAKVDVDRRLAARRRAFGSIPDFAPWISENRKREGREREEKLAKHWRRED